MLIELLSPSNYVNFNIKLAQILGLEPAIHISQLLDINEKAIRKNKLTDGFFIVDRKYITSRTTLTRDKQTSIESNLEKIGVIERSASIKNGVKLNITSLTSIMMTPDEDLLKDLGNVTKSREAKAQAKTHKIEQNLKDHIITVNSELRLAYEHWIESVLEKEGWMTTAAVIAAQSTIDNFSNRDLDIALKVLETASIHGYRDITWAINQYNRDCQPTISRSTVPDYMIQKSVQFKQQETTQRLKTSNEVF